MNLHHAREISRRCRLLCGFRLLPGTKVGLLVHRICFLSFSFPTGPAHKLMDDSDDEADAAPPSVESSLAELRSAVVTLAKSNDEHDRRISALESEVESRALVRRPQPRASSSCATVSKRSVLDSMHLKAA